MAVATNASSAWRAGEYQSPESTMAAYCALSCVLSIARRGSRRARSRSASAVASVTAAGASVISRRLAEARGDGGDLVDAADAVIAGDRVHDLGDLEERHRNAVHRDGDAVLEGEIDLGGLGDASGRIAGAREERRGHQRPRVGRRREHHRAAPQVRADSGAAASRAVAAASRATTSRSGAWSASRRAKAAPSAPAPPCATSEVFSMRAISARTAATIGRPAPWAARRTGPCARAQGRQQDLGGKAIARVDDVRAGRAGSAGLETCSRSSA